jgi:lipid-A-disaccharide synthase
MAQNLDLLMTLFPFEKECFAHTPLNVAYVGHPLTAAIPPIQKRKTSNLLALFPGSRAAEIERNFSLQLNVAKRLMNKDPGIQVAVSISHPDREERLKTIASGLPVRFVPPERNYELMRECHLGLATSGTVTLELALHGTPAVVNFAIRPLDVFLAQKIFRINLPFYCIVNIIASKGIYPELFGPNLTEDRLLAEAETLWFDETKRAQCQRDCAEVRKILGENDASKEAARLILTNLGYETDRDF